MTELQKDRQGKSSIAPTFSKRGYNESAKLVCSQLSSHCKSMGIFSDAKGKLIPQSEVEPGRNSNSSKFFGYPNEKDPIKNESARVVTIL